MWKLGWVFPGTRNSKTGNIEFYSWRSLVYVPNLNYLYERNGRYFNVTWVFPKISTPLYLKVTGYRTISVSIVSTPVVVIFELV